MAKLSEKLVVFEEYINLIENKINQKKFIKLLEFIIQEFPNLETVIKWNQPMFIEHGTYIVGLNVTKNHINIAPERATMIHYADLIQKRDVSFTKMFIQMKWAKSIDFKLIKEIISFNIIDKKDTTSFWR